MRKLFKNKKAQSVLVGIMVGIVVFIAAVIMIQPIKEMVTIARDGDHLGCSYTNLTTGERSTCIIADVYLPYFFGIVVAAGLAFVSGRFASQKF